jgi:hypothetical protein
MNARQFRVTKYDRNLRNEHGAYMGDDWTSISDIGQTFRGQRLTLADYLYIEAKYLTVLASFVEEACVEVLHTHDIENWGDRQAPSEGQRLSPMEAIEVVRAMLRGQGWCRLTARDGFYIHVGYDYYVYVGSGGPSEGSVDLAERLGLFVDRDFPSPYARED